MEETGAYLQAYRKHEKYKAELLEEMQEFAGNTETEMAEQNTYKQNPGRSEGHAFYLEPAEPYSGCDHHRKQQDRMTDSKTEKQISHIYIQLHFIS